jgi:hypothetical protein
MADKLSDLPKPSPAAQRQERLAAALRANLRRRKAPQGKNAGEGSEAGLEPRSNTEKGSEPETEGLP